MYTRMTLILIVLMTALLVSLLLPSTMGTAASMSTGNRVEQIAGAFVELSDFTIRVVSGHGDGADQDSGSGEEACSDLVCFQVIPCSSEVTFAGYKSGCGNVSENCQGAAEESWCERVGTVLKNCGVDGHQLPEADVQMCRLENPGDSINPDPAPDHCSGGGIGWGGGGGCDSSSQGGVDCPPAFSENSVDLYRGHKIESAVDLRIPVTGADFVVSRQYSSNPEYSSDGLVGERWTTSVVDVIQTEEWSQYRITRTAGGYSVTASADWENGQIPDEIPMAGASPRKWVRAVVERNGDKIPVWRLISPGQGVRDYFRMNDDYGPDGSESGTDFVEVVSIGDADANTEYPEGMLYRTVDDYGNVHRYEYGTFELFQDVDDYEEYAFRPTAIYINEDSQGIPELRVDYRWNDQVPGSPRYGRLRGIDAYRESSTEDETLVAQVTYTYMHEAISSFFSPDLGRDGDLVQVVTSMRVDAGPGESTSGSEIEDAPEQWREQITQYRYHRGDAATNGDVSSGVGTDYTWSGGDRQIKAIIQTEQIEFAHSARLSETPPTPADSMLGDSLLMLGMSDGEVIYGTGADEVRLIDLASKVVEEYYDSGPNVGRVETQYLKAGCGCSGAGSHGRKLEYAYFEHSSESATTVITELVDDQVHLITYHDLEIENDFPFLVTKVVEDGQDSSARWGTHYIYNDDRQVEFEITPSAMQSYVAHHETDGPEFTAHTDEGLVYAYIYGGAFFRAETRVGEGLHSESPFAYMLFNVVEYDGTRPHLPTKVTRFTNDDLLGPDCQSDPCQEVTEYDYGFHTEDGHDVAWVRTRVETETTGENGAVDPDPYYSSYELFDERGRNFWSRAADDALTYREFDQSGRVVLIERNADNSSLPSTHGHANENPLDTGSWPDRHSDGGSLVTTIVRDALGRVREQISPAGVSSYTVREMRPFSEAESALRYVEITLPFALGSSPETYNGPARMTWFNAAGRVIGTESYLIGAGGYTPAGVGEDPNYVRTFEDYDLGDLVARSLREYDLIGQLKSETVWHDVDDDDKSFTTLYDYDSHGRVSKVTQPNETVTATEYDVLGRVIERQTGTSVMNLKTVAEYIYDSPDASSTAGVGNGNLTRVIQYVDDSAERITDYHYDFRDRRVWTINELPPHQYVEYDHLGRVTGQAMYTAVPADLENPGYTDRGSYSWMEYNRRGLVYRQLTAVEPGVDPGAGSPEFLESNTWYDPAGRVIAQLGPGAPMSLTQFDGLGRTVASYTGASDYQALDELYDESSFAIKLNDVAVVEQTEYRYIDNTGQMDLVTTRQRLHDVEDATMGALDGTIAIAVYRGVDYDAAGRAFRQINFGTRHGDGFARESYGSGIDSITTSLTNGLQVFDLEPEDLVTETTFDEQGRVLETIDPKAIATRYVYDDLGRRIAVIENAVGTVDVGWHAEDRWEVTSGLDPNHPDRNRVTSYVYDEIGNVTKQVAHLPDGAGESVQVTEYVYGVSTTHAVASEIDSEDLLYQTIYPEGEGSTTEAERTVTYAYNRLGEMIKMVDQNGTVHVYERDALGRVTADIADSIATHIDDAVTAIGMTYDDLGRRSKVRSYSSYDAQNPGSNVVNAVEFTYTPLSQIESVIQNPFGEIGTITGTSTTRAVTLSYDTVTGGGGGGNHSRMDELTYPGGLEIGSAYGNAGSINDQISRLDTIGFQSGVHYKYIGMHMTAVVDYATPDVQLDRTTDFDGSRNYGGGGSGGGQSGNAGKYPGYDRFGRVVQHRWVDGGFRPHHGGSLHNQTDKPHVPPIYELVHTYDEASNRLARDNTTATLAWSFHDERFEYDDLHRLTQSERGTDAGSGYTQSTDQPGRQWDLDMLGNWNEQRTWDGSAYGDVETRDHSDANELTGLTPDGASTALAMTYDAAGNLLSREIEAPAGGSGTVTMHFTWDAWNRLVAVNYGSSERLKQSYNGLNWRVLKWSDATHGAAGELTQRRAMYYSPNWQLLEELIDDNWNSESGEEDHTRRMMYIWGARYIDDIIARRQTDPLGTHEPGVTTTDWYHVTDTLFSTVAILDDTATLVERISYDAYGNARHHGAGDLTGNGAVNVFDQQEILIAWGDYGVGDLNRDGTVNVLDLTAQLNDWGAAIPAGRLTPQGSSGTDNIVGYAGYLFNAEIHGSGVYIVRHRHYCPELGRWRVRDPMGYIDGMSLYQYVRSNPLRYLDPMGLFAVEFPIGLAMAAAAQAAAAKAAAAATAAAVAAGTAAAPAVAITGTAVGGVYVGYTVGTAIDNTKYGGLAYDVIAAPIGAAWGWVISSKVKTVPIPVGRKVGCPDHVLNALNDAVDKACKNVKRSCNESGQNETVAGCKAKAILNRTCAHLRKYRQNKCFGYQYTDDYVGHWNAVWEAEWAAAKCDLCVKNLCKQKGG